MTSEAITVIWRKSSRSGQHTNGNCVEVAWRKSSRSGQHTDGNCVEVAFGGLTVGVRDSKSPEGGLLSYPERGWAAFLTTCSRRAGLR